MKANVIPFALSQNALWGKALFVFFLPFLFIKAEAMVADIAIAQAIVGIDKAESNTPGQFNITLDITVQNTGSENLNSFSLLENFSDDTQLGAAFVQIVNAPEIIQSTATVNPTLNILYDGTLINADILNGDGLFEPNQLFTIRLSLEVAPKAAGAPEALQMQSTISALNTLADPLQDISDSGFFPPTTNPNQPGDTGGSDDPTPLTDCWQLLDNGLACNNTITTSLDLFCQVNLSVDAILENHFSACDGMENFPLGSFYRLEVRDWNGVLVGNDDPTTPSIYEINGADYVNMTLTVSVEECVYGNSCWGNLVIEDKNAPLCQPAMDEEKFIHYDEDCDGLIENDVNDPSGVDDLKDEYILCTLLEQNGVATYFDILEAMDEDGNEDGDLNDAGIDVRADFTDCTQIDYIYFLDEHIEVCNAADLTGIPVDESRFNSIEFQVCDIYKRTWFAVDVRGYVNEQGCSQYVFGLRPKPHRVVLEEEAITDCRSETPSLAPWFTVDNHIEKNGTGSDGPDTFFPNGDDAPSIPTAEKIHQLQAGASSCKYAVSFSDDAMIEICNGSSKLTRHWTVVDWCDGSRIYDEFTQLIKFLDNTPPVIGTTIELGGTSNLDEEDNLTPLEDFTLTTDFYSCFGSGNIPFALTFDNCSNSTNDIYNIEIERLADSPFSSPVFFTNFLNGGSINALELEAGSYRILYKAADDCGNESEAEVVMTIEDQQPPVAICEDLINVSLTNFGDAIAAQIMGSAIDDSSFDNCQELAWLVRSTNNVNPNDNNWQQAVQFSCEDVNNNQLMVELLVFEDRNGDGQFIDNINQETGFPTPDGVDDFDNGLSSTCWSFVNVEDKDPPQISCEDIVLECGDNQLETLRSLLPTEDSNGDDREDSYLFGPEVIGGCMPEWDVAVTMELIDTDFDPICKRGSFIRRFTATRIIDGEERTSTCDQLVTLDFVSDWTITLPPDLEIECENMGNRLPDPLTIDQMLITSGCESWGMEVEDETFDITGIDGNGACFKVVRTYKFINWCTWSPNNTEVAIVNRPSEFITEGREVQLRHRSRNLGINDFGDEDDDDPYNEIVSFFDVTGVAPGFPAGLDPSQDDGALVLIDNANLPQGDNLFARQYNERINNDDNVLAVYAENYGYFAYRQVIKVIDSQAPIIEQLPDLIIEDTVGSCAADLRLVIPEIEECRQTFDLTYQVFDLDNQVVYDAGSFPPLEDIFLNLDLENVPLGNYRITNTVTDNCGNQASMNYHVSIRDGKAPTAYCLFGLSIDLMSNGEVEIFASDFDAGSWDACGEIEHYSFSADTTDVSRIMNCDSVNTILLDIWVTDDAGNQAYCSDYIVVQPFGELELCGFLFYEINGIIETIGGQQMEDVLVYLNGINEENPMTTSVTGEYRLENLTPNHDYTVTPAKNTNPLNGVTTLDIIQIKKHILDIEHLDNPYSLIAADVNRSNSITTMDMIEIRKLVLQEQTTFSNNTSWRFIPKSYQFPNPANPWEEVFPEFLNFNDLNENQFEADFIAIKVGDVNGSAIPNDFDNIEGRSVSENGKNTDNETSGFTIEFDDLILLTSEQSNNNNYNPNTSAFAISVDDLVLTAGNKRTIDFIIPERKNWAGVQFTLHFNPQFFIVEDIIEGSLRTEHLGTIHINEGWITVSYDGDTPPTDRLFSLDVRALKTAALSEHLRINSQLTKAEAYYPIANGAFLTEDVIMQFSTTHNPPSPTVALYPNFPNPFEHTTTIGFDLPEAAKAKLLIHNAHGRLLYSIENEFDKGYNSISLTTDDLTGEPANVGLLFYTLETKWGRKAGRMILGG